MPTLEENKSVWDGQYKWNDGGEEWSTAWGTSRMQWYGSLLPRVSSFLPTQTVLEIAPGFGRWTEFLKDLCAEMYVVDLSDRCIEACKERFENYSHISYIVNDGKSLNMVPDNSIDFIFSFDSLVHAEDAVIEGYVSQFATKLTPNGAAFIHHSNFGCYPTQRKIQQKLSKVPKLLNLLLRFKFFEDIRFQWRDPSMTAEKMRMYANEHDLECMSQELTTWGTRHLLIDCMSIIAKNDSKFAMNNRLFENEKFMDEAKNLFNLSELYDFENRRGV